MQRTARPTRNPSSTRMRRPMSTAVASSPEARPTPSPGIGCVTFGRMRPRSRSSSSPAAPSHRRRTCTCAPSPLLRLADLVADRLILTMLPSSLGACSRWPRIRSRRMAGTRSSEATIRRCPSPSMLLACGAQSLTPLHSSRQLGPLQKGGSGPSDGSRQDVRARRRDDVDVAHGRPLGGRPGQLPADGRRPPALRGGDQRRRERRRAVEERCVCDEQRPAVVALTRVGTAQLTSLVSMASASDRQAHKRQDHASRRRRPDRIVWPPGRLGRGRRASGLSRSMSRHEPYIRITLADLSLSLPRPFSSCTSSSATLAASSSSEQGPTSGPSSSATTSSTTTARISSSSSSSSTTTSRAPRSGSLSGAA
jgi:hypothetical protein